MPSYNYFPPLNIFVMGKQEGREGARGTRGKSGRAQFRFFIFCSFPYCISNNHIELAPLTSAHWDGDAEFEFESDLDSDWELKLQLKSQLKLELKFGNPTAATVVHCCLQHTHTHRQTVWAHSGAKYNQKCRKLQQRQAAT